MMPLYIKWLDADKQDYHKKKDDKDGRVSQVSLDEKVATKRSTFELLTQINNSTKVMTTYNFSFIVNSPYVWDPKNNLGQLFFLAKKQTTSFTENYTNFLQLYSTVKIKAIMKQRSICSSYVLKFGF